MKQLFLLSLILTPFVLDAVGTSSDANQNVIDDAKALMAEARFNEAIEFLEDVIEMDADNADIWSMLGFSYRKAGELEGAETAYSNALSLDPSHIGALEYQGELFVVTGRVAEAEKNLSKLEMICGDCDEIAQLAAFIANLDGDDMKSW